MIGLDLPDDMHVSIRAPRIRTGRQHARTRMRPPSQFQSAPRAFARGDAMTRAFILNGITVSIRAPRIRTGRHQKPRPDSARIAVSIRAPRIRTGRHPREVFRVAIVQFQSAPRAFARGDKPCKLRFTRRRKFQSAPRAFARGDLARTSGPDAPHRVSIRAPRIRTGRHDLVVRLCLDVVVSIRAPRIRTGRRKPNRKEQKQACFNPRPAHSHGATCMSCGKQSTTLVSIRAPRIRTGRPPYAS